MTVRRYSDGTLEFFEPPRECNRYRFESHADAIAHTDAANRGKAPAFRLHVYLCKLCKKHHTGLPQSPQSRRKRAKGAREGFQGTHTVGKAKDHRRRLRRAKRRAKR